MFSLCMLIVPFEESNYPHSSDPTWCCLPTSSGYCFSMPGHSQYLETLGNILQLPILMVMFTFTNFHGDLQALRKTKTKKIVNSGKPKQQHIKHMILIVLHKRNLGFPVQNITGLPVGFWQWRVDQRIAEAFRRMINTLEVYMSKMKACQF